jgi:hypothetical protein
LEVARINANAKTTTAGKSYANVVKGTPSFPTPKFEFTSATAGKIAKIV